MEEPDTVRSGPPKLLGPKRRWLVLGVWILLLVAIIATQYLTARSFNHGYWTQEDPIPTTQAIIWYHLPLILIVAAFLFFTISARWFVPEKDTRTIIRAWGLLATEVAIICTLCISVWFYVFIFCMD